MKKISNCLVELIRALVSEKVVFSEEQVYNLNRFSQTEWPGRYTLSPIFDEEGKCVDLEFKFETPEDETAFLLLYA